MGSSISQKTEQALFALFPRARGDANAVPKLIDALIDAEFHRRGTPDAVSGAFHALSLTQGELLKEEFDLSTHGHSDEWTLDAVVVDPVEFTLCNMHHGFPVGDQVLKALVEAMRSVFPTAKVVRIHADGFAIVLGPTSGTTLSVEQLDTLERVLVSRVAPLVETTAKERWVPRFTLGALRWTVQHPPNWQVLGPLLWAECERAIVIAKRSAAQPRLWLERSVALDGRLPSFDDQGQAVQR